MQIANAALQSRRFRARTSAPGHHTTLIQCLPKTLQIEQMTVVILDKLRKQRNVIDYSGDLVDAAMVDECIRHARNILLIYEKKIQQSD